MKEYKLENPNTEEEDVKVRFNFWENLVVFSKDNGRHSVGLSFEKLSEACEKLDKELGAGKTHDFYSSEEFVHHEKDGFHAKQYDDGMVNIWREKSLGDISIDVKQVFEAKEKLEKVMD